MKPSVSIAVVFCLLAIAGCDMMVPPWKLSALREQAKQPVTCEAGADCDAKWGRALKWVKRHTKYVIETKSDSVIKTSKSTALSPDPSFIITKVPADNGSYIIKLETECADQFGCVPPLLELRADFAQTLMAPATSGR